MIMITKTFFEYMPKLLHTKVSEVVYQWCQDKLLTVWTGSSGCTEDCWSFDSPTRQQ